MIGNSADTFGTETALRRSVFVDVRWRSMRSEQLFANAFSESSVTAGLARVVAAVRWLIDQAEGPCVGGRGRRISVFAGAAEDQEQKDDWVMKGFQTPDRIPTRLRRTPYQSAISHPRTRPQSWRSSFVQ